jgi:hypothetical protein
MKIYFTGSVSAKKTFIEEYLNIINHAKLQGHEIIYDHIVSGSEDKINSATKEDVLKFYTEMETWIKSCDFVIADTSYPSVSVGYEIALALRNGKPVLVFYGAGGPPSLLAHNKDERLVSERYTTHTYKESINNFVQYISTKSDQRFTFFITPEIAAYLDDIVMKEKLPKSVYIRKLIERDMKTQVDL